jgi:hypothetical protein
MSTVTKTAINPLNPAKKFKNVTRRIIAASHLLLKKKIAE